MSQALTSEVMVSTNGLKFDTIFEILKVSVSGGFGDGAEGGVGAIGGVGAVGGVESRGGALAEAETFS